MKKGKLTLGLVVSLASLGALSACNEVTYADGVVLTYTDAAGKKTVVSAEDLFGAYQTTTGQISTDFDAIEEVLIRNYYKDASRADDLKALEKDAKLAVQSVKEEAETNAANNKTSYQEEFEKLLASNKVENIDELYEAKLYSLEKDKFNKNYNSSASRVEGMRDGQYEENGQVKKAFPYSAEYGRGNDGYLLDQLPYHIAHILVKISASDDNHTSAAITESESRKLSDVVKFIAGANLPAGSASTKRATFGDIAKQQSDDTGSAERYGELSVMDRKQADEFVNEFKFGIYAYEAIFNQINQNPELNPYATALRQNPTGDPADTYKLTDRLLFSADATYTDASKPATPEEEASLPDGEHYLANFFNKENGIGRIPYGAAVALGLDAVAKDPNLSYKVNNGETAYYPRNVLFNKYFNNHRVAVIVPNEIAYNDHNQSPLGTPGNYTTEDFIGVHNDAYAELPGFQVNTKDALPADVLGQDDNVLTNEKGQIILVARAGASSYQGVHFMVIERSALSAYGTTADMTGEKKVQEIPAPATGTTYADKDITTLSEYYTIYTPKSASFPTYKVGESSVAKTTYINQLAESEETYGSTRDTLEGRIKDYNTLSDTFRFQYLIENGSLTFNETNPLVAKLKASIQNWIATKRESTYVSGVESFDKSWATFAEYLTRADEARALKEDGSQKLISETCAIGYTSEDAKNGTGDWAIGGACYAKK